MQKEASAVKPRSPGEIMKHLERVAMSNAEDMNSMIRSAFREVILWAESEAFYDVDHNDCKDCACPCIGKYSNALLSLASSITEEPKTSL